MSVTKMTIREEWITPARAGAMLEANTRNRPIRAAWVKHLAREMAEGRWDLTGETIKMSNEGTLIDGQHRLSAVVRSGVTIRSAVAYGVSRRVYEVIDTGQRRSGSDTLAEAGVKYSSKAAAVITVMSRYMKGAKIDGGHSPKNRDVMRFYEAHPGIEDSVRKTRHAGRLMQPAILTACHYLFAEMNLEQADAFVTDLTRGEGLQRGDPVYVLRERMISNASSRRKLTRDDVMAMTIKAWNARREGRKMSVLRVNSTESMPEVK